MTDKDLKKLSRRDLLEMLIAQSKELEALRNKLDAAEETLRSREIAICHAGSIAEAALQLNGVFDAAQAACQQYTDNIRTLSQRQAEICARMEAESQAKAKALLDEVEKKTAAMEHDTATRCAEMKAKAKAEAQAYWDNVSDKLEVFVAEHAELRQLLSVPMPKAKANIQP